MALSTYTELQASVMAWMVRTDSVISARVPDFIRLGETRLFRRLRLSGMISPTATLTVPAGQNWVALPDDWLAFKRLRTAAEPKLNYLPADQLADLPGDGDATVYSIEGRRFYYGQTPGANLAFTMAYYQRPAALSTTGSNWVLTENPDLYLYAALIEGWQFAQNSAKAGEYGTLFEKAVSDAMSADQAALISGGPLRKYRR